MGTTKNVEMQIFNGTDYDTLYPKVNLSNITGKLMLSNTTETLAVFRGGTGMTSNPSMLTNLSSTSAANVFQSSPRPGITGTLAVNHGGTGSTNAGGAMYNLINGLSAVSGLADGDWIPVQDVSAGKSGGRKIRFDNFASSLTMKNVVKSLNFSRAQDFAVDFSDDFSPNFPLFGALYFRNTQKTSNIKIKNGSTTIFDFSPSSQPVSGMILFHVDGVICYMWITACGEDDQESKTTICVDSMVFYNLKFNITCTGAPWHMTAVMASFSDIMSSN